MQALNVTSAYDDFLFAPMDDRPGATRLSVLSALARLDLDPWEEAARLAALPTPDAEKTLASVLCRVPSLREGSPEVEVLAARLVALLPKARAATAKMATVLKDDDRTLFWAAWVCFGILMWFLAGH